MATTILGIDLGTYSVKVARLEVSFRNVHLMSIEEQRLPDLPLTGTDSASSGETASAESEDAVSEHEPVEHSLLSRQMRALEALMVQQKQKGETSVVALGEEVTLRMVDMPLSDPKKVALTLPYELSGQLLTELDDQIVDQTMAQAAKGGGDTSTLWVAACVPHAAVREKLQALSALGLDPRLVGATALCGAALFATPPKRTSSAGKNAKPKAEPIATSPMTAPQYPLWVLDIGHSSTHVCALGPHPTRSGQLVPLFVRTIARAGHQLTQALARALNVTTRRAEELKHRHGVSEDAEPTISGPLKDALRPLIRELRQTLSAFGSRYGESPHTIQLTGGTGQMPGLSELLTAELGIEAMALLPPTQAQWLQQAQRDVKAAFSVGASDDTAMKTHIISGPALVRRWPTGATSVGLALAAASTSPQVNFRKGDLAFRTDYAFVREQAKQLSLFAVALLLCAGVWAYSSLRLLEKDSERLRLQLISETTALFGEPRTDGQKVSAELNSALSAEKGSGPGIPAVSALDLLEDISRAAPDKNAAGPAKLDIVDLSIRPKKTDLKATCGSAQYVDDLAAALGKIPCFKNVQKGKVLTVKNTDKDGKTFDVKQFSLEITTTCP